MHAVDNENFPDYTYCAINQSYKHRKDDKIQFVALIVSKPKVGADKRLQWRVVDRTGEVSAPCSPRQFKSWTADKVLCD